MQKLKFKVVAVKQRSRWSVLRGATRIVAQIQHDDPNDWPLDGILKFHVQDPAEAARYRVGQVYEVGLELLDGPK